MLVMFAHLASPFMPPPQPLLGRLHLSYLANNLMIYALGYDYV